MYYNINMKSYLSVDLDYWGMSESATAVGFINKIISLNKPISVYNSHESILDDLNKRRVDHIYQVDFHSDIVESYDKDSDLILEEGTWANFYHWRKNCTFEWRYPSTKSCFTDRMGRCDLSQYDDKPWPRKKFPYKKVIRRQGLHYIDWSSVSAIGFAISPTWYEDQIDYLFDRYDFLNHPAC